MDNEINIKIVDNGYIISGRFRHTKLPDYVERTSLELFARLKSAIAGMEKMENADRKIASDFEKKYPSTDKVQDRFRQKQYKRKKK